jgi:hypothetical protein
MVWAIDEDADVGFIEEVHSGNGFICFADEFLRFIGYSEAVVLDCVEDGFFER